MYEGIKSREDREFTTSLGHWTGDIAWNPGPIGGKSGLIQFTCPPDNTPQSATLLYPNIKALKGKINQAQIYLYFPAPIGDVIYATLTLTDGIYTYATDWWFTITPNLWLLFAVSADIPADWDQEHTSLILEAQNDNTEEHVFYADDASLWAESAKIQYLPLMGIG